MTSIPPVDEIVDVSPGEVGKQAENAEQKEGIGGSMPPVVQLSKLRLKPLVIDRPYFSPWTWEPSSEDTFGPDEEQNPRTIFEKRSLIRFNIKEFTVYATESRELHFKKKD